MLVWVCALVVLDVLGLVLGGLLLLDVFEIDWKFGSVCTDLGDFGVLICFVLVSVDFVGFYLLLFASGFCLGRVDSSSLVF